MFTFSLFFPLEIKKIDKKKINLELPKLFLLENAFLFFPTKLGHYKVCIIFSHVINVQAYQQELKKNKYDQIFEALAFGKKIFWRVLILWRALKSFSGISIKISEVDCKKNCKYFFPLTFTIQCFLSYQTRPEANHNKLWVSLFSGQC